jgi:hypothetical protein
LSASVTQQQVEFHAMEEAFNARLASMERIEQDLSAHEQVCTPGNYSLVYGGSIIFFCYCCWRLIVFVGLLVVVFCFFSFLFFWTFLIDFPSFRN